MDPALYYRPSGRISPMVLPALLASIVGIWPFAWLYAWICDNIPFIYLDVFATLGYSIVAACFVYMAAAIGKARNPIIMGVLGWLFATIAWYVQWACWLNIVVHEHPADLPLEIAQANSMVFSVHPEWIFAFMASLLKHGAWTFRSLHVSGIISAICWVAEYVIIISFPIYLGYMVAGSPYCEGEQHRANEKEMKLRFKLIEDTAEFVRQAEAEPDALSHLLKRAHDDVHDHAKLTIWVCGEGEDCYATVENVTHTWKDGKRKEEETLVLRYLRISWQAAQVYLHKSAEIEKRQEERKAEKAKAAEEKAKKADDETAQSH
ncbi:MAG: APC family permease [Burkholderiales bacterium]|nr:APC family permease [Burkholderiales bacterium]